MSREAALVQSAADDAFRAARKLEEAATRATDAADRIEEAIRRFEQLAGSGYGNNIERFIQLADERFPCRCRDADNVSRAREAEKCQHCQSAECQCSDADVSPDIGDK